MKQYRINEIFYSIQGEGVRAGTANVFVRFSGCNLTCNGSEEGEAYQPVCDTEFASGSFVSAEQIVTACVDCFLASDPAYKHGRPWVILTGGEPALQLDSALLEALHAACFSVAIETNGTRALPPTGLDWITVSPKTAEHTIVVKEASEVKYVRHRGQSIPRSTVDALHYLISPAFRADGSLDTADLNWCIQLVKAHPNWRLSVQQHKAWRIR